MEIKFSSDIPEEIIDCFINLFERLEALEKHQVAEYKVFKDFYMSYIENSKKIKLNKKKEG